MPEQLWLQEPRSTLQEPAASFHIECGPGGGKAFDALIREGYFTITAATAWYEEVGGVIMGAPDLWNMHDMVPPSESGTGFYVTGSGTWAAGAVQPQPFRRADGTGIACYAYRDTNLDGLPWSCTSQRPVLAGCPILLRFITYDQQTSSGSVEAGENLVLYFGGHLRLRLNSDGLMDLAEQTLDKGDGDGFHVVACERWMTAGTWAPAEHFLLLYECGARVVVRNVQKDGDGKALGLTYIDPAGGTPYPTTDAYMPVPDVANHILEEGAWKLVGRGNVTFCLTPMYWQDGTVTTIARGTPDTVGVSFEGKTTAACVRIAGLRQCVDGVDNLAILGPTIACTGYTYAAPDGTPWPFYVPPAAAPDPVDPSDAAMLFDWSLSWQNSAFGTVMLTGWDITLPALNAPNGATATDLFATDGASVQSVKTVRDPDLSRESAQIHVLQTTADLSPFRRANMPIRYVDASGDTLFRGYANGRDWNTTSDFPAPTTPVGHFEIEAEGMWARIKHAKWRGGGPWDGRLLSDCLAEAAVAVGMASTDYDLSQLIANDITIPSPPTGQAPTVVFKPGVNMDQIFDDVRRKYLGTNYYMMFDVVDGKFKVISLAGVIASDTPTANFYQTTAAAAADDVPNQVILGGTFKVHIDDSEQQNQITVIGQDSNENILLAQCADWPSIRGGDDGDFPTNYLGEIRQAIVIDPALCTQSSVNSVCSNLYQRYRWPRVTYQWQSCRMPGLAPGLIVRLVGDSYGEGGGMNVYLRGLSFERATTGLAHRPTQAVANYLAEAIVGGVVQGPTS